MRPDSRLSMNQTMIAIFEANPQAFSGNINRLKAGASLKFQVRTRFSRSAAASICSGQTTQRGVGWSGGLHRARHVLHGYLNRCFRRYVHGSGSTTAPDTTETRPSLVLVPPDEEPAGLDYEDEFGTTEPLTREQEMANRIAELEAADVPDQQSLIEIRDNELATLRQELANIRGETYEPPVDDLCDVADDELIDDEPFGG